MASARPFCLATLAVLTGCTTAAGPAPSLAPRTAESIDPRAPVLVSGVERSVDPALAARLADLIRVARAGDSAFGGSVAEAQRLAAAAGARQSEGWIVAQQALSAAVAARAPTARALGDIDAIAATSLARQGGLAPADLTAIEAAAEEVSAIDRRQARMVDSLQARLGS